MGKILSKGTTVESAKVVQRIRQKYALLSRAMDRRFRRQWAAIEAMDLGWGGIRAVSLATGLDRHTILAGTRELKQRPTVSTEKISRPAGGGRKPLTQSDPELPTALEALVNPSKGENPSWSLRWTCQSTAKLAEELQRQNHPVSDRTVASLLQASGYSLQDKRRCNEGSSHLERNAQFAYINEQATAFHRQRQPVLWVDTKKKELAAQGHASGEDWINVGVDHDTARFAAESVARWWQEMGARRFPKAAKLLIIADVGASNRNRNRLWKVALQDLASGLGLPLEICHFPPGTIRWHKIEHRLVNFITKDWHGQSLISYHVMVNLIARTKHSHGLKLAQGNIRPANFHIDWNYAISPFR